MKAVVLTGPGHVACVTDWPEPTCGPNDVIVRMMAIGLCGSDLSVAQGNTRVPELPWLIGHEGGGNIVAVGAEVRDRQVGERVVIEPNICCFECETCKAGVTSACLNRRVLGIKEAGIAAERVAVPAEFARPVPAGTSAATLACIEPWVVTNAAIRRANVRPGDRCLVIGAGSQGLLLCVSLIALGVTPDVIELHEGRLALAVEWGARRAAGGKDYQYVFETSGAAAVFPTALSSVGYNATIVVIGQSHTPVELTTRELVQRQMTIRGSLIYDHPIDFDDSIAQLAGGIDLPRVLKRRVVPDDIDGDLAFVRDVPGKSWIDLSSWMRG